LPIIARYSLLIFAYGVLMGCTGNSDPNRDQPMDEAIELAVSASHDEGILIGNPTEADAKLMALYQAEEELTHWGAVFPTVEDYPSPDTPVWVVSILGSGVRPGPAGSDKSEQCLDIRVIVPHGSSDELALFGKAGSGCR
jgi:hypothetical protein